MEAEFVKVVTVKLTRVRVTSYAPRDGTVILEIYFNDGMDKQIFRTTEMAPAEEVAEKVLDDVIRMEENINMEFDQGELVSEVRVVVEDYEHVRDALTVFFRDLHQQMKIIRAMHESEGYLDRIRAVNRAELRLHG